MLYEVITKVDDYFIRCGLAAYDPKAEGPLNPALTTYEALSTQELETGTEAMVHMPLARIESGRPLPLRQALNPAWTRLVDDFSRLLVTPLLGETDQLQASQWRQIKTTMAPFEAWQAEKLGAEVEGLGLNRIKALLAGEDRERLAELIARNNFV